MEEASGAGGQGEQTMVQVAPHSRGHDAACRKTTSLRSSHLQRLGQRTSTPKGRTHGCKIQTK